MTRFTAIHALLLAGIVSFVQPAVAASAQPFEQVGAISINANRTVKPLDASRDHTAGMTGAKDANDVQGAAIDNGPADFRLLGSD